MKISKIIFTIAILSIFTIISCKDTKSNSATTEEHGHEHDADGNHISDEKVEQEEFSVNRDSLKTKEETHTHDSGSEHNNH